MAPTFVAERNALCQREEMSIPPEVHFDRFFRNVTPFNRPVRPEDPDSRPYKGKQDLASLPSDLQSLLESIQTSFNEALLSEKLDVREHAPHPPFHFDYVDSKLPNALAFRYEKYSFIGMTMGLVYLLWGICLRLARSREVRTALSLNPTVSEEGLHIAFLRSQLFFVVAHEYTHHVHGHVSESVFGTEILSGNEVGSLQQQMFEVDADGYAAYHVLAHLFSEGREHATALLSIAAEADSAQNKILFSCFVTAIGAYFFARAPEKFTPASLYGLTHPPQAARMNLLMQSALSWCKQNHPDLVDWMTLQQFQQLMNAVARATWGMNGGRDWTDQTTFFASEQGGRYFEELDKLFKAHVRSMGLPLSAA